MAVCVFVIVLSFSSVAFYFRCCLFMLGQFCLCYQFVACLSLVGGLLVVLLHAMACCVCLVVSPTPAPLLGKGKGDQNQTLRRFTSFMANVMFQHDIHIYVYIICLLSIVWLTQVCNSM